MELRRALLLFAVVLGLAAIASSLSRPAEEERSTEPPAQSTSRNGVDGDKGRNERAKGRDREEAPARASSDDPSTIRFEAGGKAPERLLEAGVATMVVVAVEEPSQVRIDGLGLVQPAEPLTPARFDVLVERRLTSEVLVTPAGGGPSESVGTLVVESAP